MTSFELLRSESAAPAGTVVLIPGVDGTALLFYRQLPLLRRRFHVLQLPLPNDPRCTMSDMVAFVRGEVEARAEGDVLLCGESFGGALALSVAVELPTWLRALVIVNSFAHLPMQWRLRTATALVRVVPWSVMSLARRFTESRLQSRHTLPEDLREFRARMRHIGRAGYLRRLELLQSYDVRASLHRIEVPTLLLAADCDRLLPSLREARFMADHLPRATLRVLSGFGHACLINHDLDLLEHIESWLAQVHAAPA